MKFIQFKSIVIGALFSIAIQQVECAEVFGRSVTPDFIGEKLTGELRDVGPNEMDLTLKPQVSLPELIKPLRGSCSRTFDPNHPAQRIGLNFTAATVSNAPQTDVIPPNQTGWVGDKQYILMSYGVIRSFDKNTGLPDHVLNTDSASFFNGTAQDVRIEYDRFAKRWYMTAQILDEVTDLQTLVLAVSSDSIITNSTVWSFYVFSNAQVAPIGTVGTNFLDYNQLAVDKNAVYISLDIFTNTDVFVGTSALVIEKKSLLKGHPHVTVFAGLLPGPAASAEFTPPADNFDKHAEFGYLIHASLSDNALLYLYRIQNPGSAFPSIFGPISIAVPPYSQPSSAPHKGNLYEPLFNLQTGLFGGLMAPHVRDHQLFACHPIQVNSAGEGTSTGDRVGVRWYQLDLTGDSSGRGRGNELVDTVPILIQSGTLFDPAAVDPNFYYIPSIMTNRKLDMVIAATVSSNTMYVNAVYAGRHKSDPPGLLRFPVLLTKNIAYTYNFGSNRWGDESGLSPDPVDDIDMWATSEWAAVQNGWGMQVTQLKRVRPRPKGL